MESWTMVAASTTVGTPIPITFTWRFSSVSPVRWFPTPEPGLIPVSVIWMVRFRRLVLLAASASMAMTTSGFVSATIPCMISEVSIPVCAITPGMIPLVRCIFSLPKLCRPYSRIICLVMLRFSTTWGPRESAVMAEFPSPTTRMDCSFSRWSNFLRCRAISPEISLW